MDQNLERDWDGSCRFRAVGCNADLDNPVMQLVTQSGTPIDIRVSIDTDEMVLVQIKTKIPAAVDVELRGRTLT